jgi:molecular chaperone GrpE (heat shock protein)
MTISERIINTWAALRGHPTFNEIALQKQIVTLKRQISEQQLELQEAANTVNAQRSKLEELSAQQRETGSNGLGDLYRALAAPLSQIRLQASLLDSGKEISGRSVMALAAQLADLLEQTGLEPIGCVGQTTTFDPQQCEPMITGKSFQPGSDVTVKFVGYRYEGHVVRKALVDA